MVNGKNIIIKKSIYNLLQLIGALLAMIGFGGFFALLNEGLASLNFKNVTPWSYWVTIIVGLLGFVIFYLSNKTYNKSFRNSDN